MLDRDFDMAAMIHIRQSIAKNPRILVVGLTFAHAIVDKAIDAGIPVVT